MLNKPPLVSTYKTPEDIIGSDNMDTFIAHYKIASSSVNGGEFPDKRLNKEIGLDIRASIAETYIDLHENGYVPVGFKDGKIQWATLTKSDSQVEFESGLRELEGKSMDELRNIARYGWKKIIKKVDMNESHRK